MSKQDKRRFGYTADDAWRLQVVGEGKPEPKAKAIVKRVRNAAERRPGKGPR